MSHPCGIFATTEIVFSVVLRSLKVNNNESTKTNNYKIEFETGFAMSNFSSQGRGIPRGNLGAPLEVIC